jgi:hypothetical protein
VISPPTWCSNLEMRAAGLLLAPGRVAIERGALATAVDVLRRARQIGALSGPDPSCRGLGASQGGSTSRSGSARKSLHVWPGLGMAQRCTFGWLTSRSRQPAGRWPPTARKRRRVSIAPSLLLHLLLPLVHSGESPDRPANGAAEVIKRRSTELL